MTESDIMLNMIDAHSDNCTCDSCQCIDPKCQDNADQCEEVEQPSERRKKMKPRLIPVMVNCAMLLLFIGLAEISVRANDVPEPIEISSAVQNRIIVDAEDINNINIVIDAVDNIENIDDINNIVIKDMNDIYDIVVVRAISPTDDIEINVGIDKGIEV